MNTRNVTVAIMGLCLALGASALPISPKAPNLEPPREGRPYPPIMVPEGGDKLLSRDCPVTSSAGEKPIRGEWGEITDGHKAGAHEDKTALVKYASGAQWVQIDLRTSQVVNAIWIWRHLEFPSVCRDLIIQLSDDADFIDGVTTVFNNDHDNSAGLGKGDDKEYIDWNRGRGFPVPSLRVRYVRVYSNGQYPYMGNLDPFNYCTEIEVYGGEPTSPPGEKVLKVEIPKPGFM